MALSIANSEPEIPSIKTITQIEKQLETKEPKFEEISLKLKEDAKTRRLKEEKACEARGGSLRASECIVPVYTPPAPIVAYTPPQPVVQTVGELTGSLGYTIAWGNCVNQVPISIRPNGNPISWLATTQTPYIGAVALWHYNHTGIVTGLWSNGDIEVRHENGGGLPHRFPRSAFRGFR